MGQPYYNYREPVALEHLAAFSFGPLDWGLPSTTTRILNGEEGIIHFQTPQPGKNWCNFIDADADYVAVSDPSPGEELVQFAASVGASVPFRTLNWGRTGATGKTTTPCADRRRIFGPLNGDDFLLLFKNVSVFLAPFLRESLC